MDYGLGPWTIALDHRALGISGKKTIAWLGYILYNVLSAAQATGLPLRPQETGHYAKDYDR